MKTRTTAFIALIAMLFMAIPTKAENEERNVSAFTEIALRIPAKLHLEQGKKQSLEIVAKTSTLEEIITEVKGDELVIRFPNKNYIWKNFNPGEIDIFITVPEIDALSLSGSGDIIADDDITSHILDLSVSGSGDISLPYLKAERLKASISGSGDIEVGGKGSADDLSVTISGSGDFKGSGFEASDAMIRIAGSGNVSCHVIDNLKVRVAGSGDVRYKGNPRIDQSVAGSGTVKRY